MRYLFSRHKQAIIIFASFLFAISFFIFLPRVFSEHYSFEQSPASTTAQSVRVKIFTPTYVPTPDVVKGIYMTSWTASQSGLRDTLVKLIGETELNTVVIDIKDYSGKIVFPITSPTLKSFGSEEIRIALLPEFIETLHKKNIYVVGRIAVFQDAYFVKYRPDLAVKDKAGTNVWKDYKGISWIDPGSREYWDYIVLLAEESRKIGFDEINFDYIRFPSDGNMRDISYPWSSTTPKATVLKDFFQYLHSHLSSQGEPLGENRLKMSADLFGMTTTAENDMGIGQVLENTLPYFDYVSPMVYPSHYPPSFEGFKNPEEHPYEVVHSALQSAVERANKLDLVTTSTTSSITPVVESAIAPEQSSVHGTAHYGARLRPWLQDFGLKMDYGPLEVKAQIKAVNDSGLTSWLLWSASNKYTKVALEEN